MNAATASPYIAVAPVLAILIVISIILIALCFTHTLQDTRPAMFWVGTCEWACEEIVALHEQFEFPDMGQLPLLVSAPNLKKRGYVCETRRKFPPMNPKAKVWRPTYNPSRTSVIQANRLRLVGVGCLCFTPSAIAPCEFNEYVGVRERIVAKIKPLGIDWPAIQAEIYRDPLFRAPAMPYVENSALEWLAARDIPAAKRVRIFKSIMEGNPLTAKMFKRQTMLKLQEKLLCTERKAGRLISMIDDGPNVALSPFTTDLTEHLKPKENAFSRPYSSLMKKGTHLYSYPGGLDANGLSERFNMAWARTGDPVFLEFDARRWDMSYRYQYYRILWKFYLRHNPPAGARKTLRAQWNTRGTTSHGVKYSVPGTRKSGDPNTTIGNSIMNTLLHHCLIRRLEKAGLVYRCEMLLVSGDDMLAMFDRKPGGTNYRIQKLCAKFYAEVGLDAKYIGVRGDPCHMSFCSGMFLPVGFGRFKFSQLPGRFLAKFGWTASIDMVRAPDVGHEYEARCAGIVSTASHVPIVSSLLRTREGVVPIYKPYSWASTDERTEVHDEAWIALADRYYLPIKILREVAHLCASAKKESMIHHWAIPIIIETDTGVNLDSGTN
jgi:hypothetical protein